MAEARLRARIRRGHRHGVRDAWPDRLRRALRLRRDRERCDPRATPVGRGEGGADPPEPTRPRGGGGRYRDNRGWRARPQRVHAPGAGIRRRFPEIFSARPPVSTVSFSTIAQPNPRALLLIEIPESVVAKVSAGKRVPVRVTLNGVA